MSSITVITLARGRSEHLSNFVRALAMQSRQPLELIVAVMQEQLYQLPMTSYSIRQIRISALDLPLAAARNAAARAATGDILVFLDMDCIASPGLLEDYANHLEQLDGLLMGEVLYLPRGAVAGELDFAHFHCHAVKHSDRRGPPHYGIELCHNYRCFWSLNYAMRQRTFLSSGGFDERYRGYGGEDTDYSKSLSLQRIPIAWVKGALAYHQYHSHHMPPVHHLYSVVRNAELFELKWGYRTMGHWLHAFRLMGLIDDTPGQPIRILRLPNEDDFALTAQQSHQPYINTASIINLLEQRAI